MKKIVLLIGILILPVLLTAQTVGKIVDLKGDVFINHQPAEIGIEIHEKDAVGTQKGEAEVLFSQGRIYLGEYTQVRVANLYPLEIEVWHGEILTLFLEPVAITTPHQKFFLEGTWRVVVDPYQTNKYKLLEESREEYIKEKHYHYYYYPYHYPLRTGWWYPYWGGWLRIGWCWNRWYWNPYWSCYRYRSYRYPGRFLSIVSKRQLRQKIRSSSRIITSSSLKPSSIKSQPTKKSLRASSLRTSRTQALFRKRIRK